MGYKSIDRSLILARSLEGSSFNHVEFEIRGCQEWLKSFCQISGTDIDSHGAHLEILNRIEDKAIMVVMVENKVEIACAVGVISNGYFGLFDLVTQKSVRNRGYGIKLVNGMLNWAVTSGATYAYLQVVAENRPAISLYHKLGYQYCYEYWYRISGKPNKASNSMGYAGA